MDIRKPAATVAALLLLAACEGGPGDAASVDPVANDIQADTLTGQGEASDPLAAGAGNDGSIGSPM